MNTEAALHDDYNEEEDEDFDPTQVGADGGDGDGRNGTDDADVDADVDADDEDDDRNTNYSKIESETGGLVKTRRARELEELNNRSNRYEGLANSVSTKANDIWDELRITAFERLNRQNNGSVLSDNSNKAGTDSATGEEVITIERTYKFAGETIREKKTVPISSAEAVEYLNNLKFQETKAEQEVSTKKIVEQEAKDDIVDRNNLRRPLKRKPMLEQIISGSLKPKLSTLEKSKLDWATYVDKEGINDELNAHNKDGYLAKQDFLNKVDSVKEKEYREMRRKEMTMRLENQT